MWTVKVSRSFSAAHFIGKQGGKCEELHGHNYRVEVAVSARRLKEPGMVVDFVELRRQLERILPDHQLLNKTYNFNPTAENLAKHFFDEMAKFYPVVRVSVWENDDCCAEYTPDNSGENERSE